MADTQWPTYVVFHQAMEGKPHLHAGSVHAPDPELALMNARDVFVRRPPCVSLWVAPSDQVLALTKEQLADSRWEQIESSSEGKLELYLVFKKSQPAGACAYNGEIEAQSPVDALKTTLARPDSRDGLLWWVVPARAVTRSTPAEIESLFAPAAGKLFRHQSDFNTLTQMRRLAAQDEKRDIDET